MTGPGQALLRGVVTMASGRSPVALYLLAALRETSAADGPWEVEDDPSDRFHFRVRRPAGEFVVGVQQRSGSVVRLSVLSGVCPSEVLEAVREMFSAPMWLEERQEDWAGWRSR